MVASICDLISPEVVNKLTETNIEIGSVFFMPFYEEDGITPKSGDDHRYKWFIVLGVDEDEIYCGVVLNTEINKNLSKNLIDSHIPIYKSRYNFLDHNCHINCSQLLTKKKDFFSILKYKGKFESEDVEVILNTILGVGATAPKILKRFHIKIE